MGEVVTRILIGYSVVSCAVLLAAYVFLLGGMRKTRTGIAACSFLLVALAVLQLLHWQFLEQRTELFESPLYVAILLTIPPAFFFFSREVLMPDRPWRLIELLHLVPILLGLVLPTRWVILLALAIGAGYAVWIVGVVLKLRRQVRRFRFEAFFFSFFALLSTAVLILGIASPWLDTAVFYYSYANFTGLSFILIVTALIGFPELLDDLSAAAELAYAKSTLGGVDVEARLAELDRLMSEEKLYQNENLNLASLAEALDLSSHQLSELINTTFGYGFSRYVREQRVAEAKALLEKDDRSSILSIGLATGFRSQSNFYTAFREVTGQSPGDYRKRPG